MLDGFLLECNGITYQDGNGFAQASDSGQMRQPNGSHRTVRTFVSDDSLIEVTSETVSFPGLSLVERCVRVKNVCSIPITVTRIDTVKGLLPAGNYLLKYFTCSHGKEFTPNETPLAGTKILETTTGRSSLGVHPWFSLEGQDGSVLACAIAWSGNWIIRFNPMPESQYQITGGLSDWQFSKTIQPGEILDGIPVVYGFYPCGGQDVAAVEFGRWGRKYWYPANTLLSSGPIEWNHWYPYIDKYINEDVFRANVDKCAELGFDVCTLDAGWFGRPDQESEWYTVRGDWHKVNTQRFPSGIRALADHVHGKGMKFGLWCEIEAAGAQADLNTIHPELIARRDGDSLGYVCMGNPEAVQWAFGVLEDLIVRYGADWLKLDFNLSPGAGCNRTDHGHQAGDGLYEHYRGYYRLLDMVREKYPDVLLENCSGGGLRIDLGLMSHLHLSFLSDPDYPPHAFQVFWGAAAMLHPSACLHWAWSQTTKDHKKNGENNPIREDMPPAKFDYIVRNALLKNPGFSQKLIEYPNWCLARLKYHLGLYKSTLSRFICNGDCYRLTSQSLRTGDGEKWNSFLYVMEGRNSAILFVFRQPGAEEVKEIKLKGLAANKKYRLEYQDRATVHTASGESLMKEGIHFEGMPEESSEVVLIQSTEKACTD